MVIYQEPPDLGFLVSVLRAAKCFIESNPPVHAPAVAGATAAGNRNRVMWTTVQIDPTAGCKTNCLDPGLGV